MKAIGIACGFAALCLFIAACGGHARPTVAELPSATTSSSSGARDGPATSGDAAEVAPAPGSRGDFPKLSACMRAHGISDYPVVAESHPPGAVSQDEPREKSDLNPNSPVFQAAQKACAQYEPGPLPAAEYRQMLETEVKLADCMHSHGIPEYPEPVYSPDGGGSRAIAPYTGPDPNSPIYKRAEKTCSSILRTSSGPGA